ncbi:MAG: saccharopine dehydrogenase C-terminal domain-containing protein [Gammaproteobacteria bacterium]|nr:saccharopine dehydrogenase C-terminal domain-containing protein [Gammaproteobacteria bacterium]
MQHVLVIGAGKIGSLIAFLLANSKDYTVYLADLHLKNRPDLDRVTKNTPNLELIELDASNSDAVRKFIKSKSINAIVPCLSYYFNVPLAQIAKELNLHYFDLTEDVTTTNAVLDLAQNVTSAFVTQCGLAPGFISIVANHLMQHFPTLDTVKMRVGALPTNISNALEYSLTWSTDGLINEYGNMCNAIEQGKEVATLPLEGWEEIKVDGLTYEAFNTSGGIGSLATTYFNKVKSLSYKTIRYPGHCAKIRFLMNDLKLNEDRATLKRILENAIPKTYQDVVLVYVSVTGTQDNQFIEENYVKKFYPQKIHGLNWSAIQLTTASSLCAVLDLVLSQPKKYSGLIRQEEFSLEELTSNRFGKYYA